MTATHTKGPWRADSMGVIMGGPSHLTSVCQTYAVAWANSQATTGHRHSQEAADFCGAMFAEAEANARLIAAAPDLLEACKDLLSGWMYIRKVHGDLYGVGWDRAQQKAIDAIAAAEKGANDEPA